MIINSKNLSTRQVCHRQKDRSGICISQNSTTRRRYGDGVFFAALSFLQHVSVLAKRRRCTAGMETKHESSRPYTNSCSAQTLGIWPSHYNIKTFNVSPSSSVAFSKVQTETVIFIVKTFNKSCEKSKSLSLDW